MRLNRVVLKTEIMVVEDETGVYKNPYISSNVYICEVRYFSPPPLIVFGLQSIFARWRKLD